MDANFFSAAPNPQADPQGFAMKQRMAQALMQQGASSPQGKTVGGQYVAPTTGQYVGQAAAGLLGGMQQAKVADAARASNILNGGTGTGYGMGNGFSQIGTALKGFFGGA